MKCVMCGETMFGPEKGSVDYRAYPNTHLWDIDVYKCKCGEEEVSIPQIDQLDELLDQMPSVTEVRWTGQYWYVVNNGRGHLLSAIKEGKCPFGQLKEGQTMGHCPAGFPGCACMDELMADPDYLDALMAASAKES
jgi:hypothetical protein